jgi:hypothetical protein
MIYSDVLGLESESEHRKLAELLIKIYLWSHQGDQGSVVAYCALKYAVKILRKSLGQILDLGQLELN